MSGKQSKAPKNDPQESDQITVLSDNLQHAPLLVPKRERDYAGRPASAIPRDPRQRATEFHTKSSEQLETVVVPPSNITIKQEPTLHTDIEVKEEKLDDSELAPDWKDRWLRDNQAFNDEDAEQAASDWKAQWLQNNKPAESTEQEITSNISQLNVKQEPVEEIEPEPPIEDQCSVDSSSTVGLPSPKRMESFSAPASPASPARPALEQVKPTSSKYSAPLDLEQEYEEMEREEQRQREAALNKSVGEGYAQHEESDLDDTINSDMSDSMDQSEPPVLPEPTTPVKRSTFQVIKNPEVFKDVPTGSSANDAMDTDGAPNRANKIPVKVTKQNRSSMLVEDYLKSADVPVKKRSATAPAAPKVSKRPKPDNGGANVEVGVTDLLVHSSPSAGPSRDPRLRKKNFTEPEQIVEDPLSAKLKECILRRIAKWSFIWVEQQIEFEQQKQKSTSAIPCPPILQRLNDPPLPELSVMHTLGAYSSFQAYVDVYQPLLLHEIWSHSVKQYVKMARTITWTGTLQYVDDVKRRPDDIRPVKFSTMLEEGEDKKHRPVYLQEGDLVTCRFNRPKSADLIDILGYVNSVKVSYGMRNKKVDHRVSNTNKDVLIEAVLLFRQNYARVNPTGVYQLTKVSSLKSLMVLFDYEAALHKSKLCQTILRPDVGSFKLMFGGPRYQADFLDQAQVDAVMTIAQTMMMSPPDEPKVALLEGAPGTGKTHLLVFIMQHLLAFRENRHRILYCAPTDSAVDELTRRLLTLNSHLPENTRFKVVRLGGRNTHSTVVNYTVKGNVERKGLASSVKSPLTAQVEQIASKMEELQRQMVSIRSDIDKSEEAMNDEVTGFLRKKLENLEEEVVSTSEELDDMRKREEANLKELFEDLKMTVINSADVVCTTMDPVSNPELDDYLKCLKRRRESNDPPFLCCIMDDATMCSEPQSLFPLAFGVNKLLLVGDADPVYNTLNSVVAKQNGLSKSLFGRFQEFVNEHASSDVRLKIRLEVQYRMAWPIWLWTSRFYYGNNVIVPEGREPDTPLHFFRVLDIRDGQEASDGDSLVNEPEAKLIASIVVEAFNLNRHSDILMKKSVAVVTFSPKQRDMIKREIDNKYKDLESRSVKLEKQLLEVALAQDLQGKEKDIVIVSCVKSKLPQRVKNADEKRVKNVVEFEPSKLEFITDFWNTALTRAKETLIVIGKLKALLPDETLRDFIKDAERRQVIRDVSSRYHPSIVFDIIEKPDESF